MRGDVARGGKAASQEDNNKLAQHVVAVASCMCLALLIGALVAATSDRPSEDSLPPFNRCPSVQYRDHYLDRVWLRSTRDTTTTTTT